MTEFNEPPTIRDPETELRAIFEARIKPFRELEQSSKVAQYERAFRLAAERLEKAREERGDDAA